MIKRFLMMCAVLLIPALARAQDDGYGNMNMNGGWHMMNGYGGVLMWIVLIGVVVLIVFLVTQVSGNKGTPHTPHTPHETALDVLKKRYARGEISKEQFEQMKKDLNA